MNNVIKVFPLFNFITIAPKDEYFWRVAQIIKDKGYRVAALTIRGSNSVSTLIPYIYVTGYTTAPEEVLQEISKQSLTGPLEIEMDIEINGLFAKDCLTSMIAQYVQSKKKLPDWDSFCEFFRGEPPKHWFEACLECFNKVSIKEDGSFSLDEFHHKCL